MGVLCPGPGRGLDEVGAERAALLAEIDAGPTAIFFAATKPERVNALILSHTTAKFVATDDYPIGIPPEVAEELVAQIDQLWGSEALAAMVAPSRAGDQRFRRWSGKLVRAGASPGAAQRFLRALLEVDVRRLVEEFGGQLIKTTGDGMLATFDGPGRAQRRAGWHRPPAPGGAARRRG